VCQLDTLKKCRNRADLRKTLSTLPPTLDKTYDRILCAIDANDFKYAVRVLLWLAFSDRPLTVDEVAEVVAIDVDRDSTFEREEVFEDPMEALEICSSLVSTASDNSNRSLQPTRKVAMLAHYSVKEYLVSDRIQQGQAARYSMQAAACHSIIARACLGYLGQLQEPEPRVEDTLGKYKLAQYSARFWSSHAQKVGDRTAETSRAALTLLSKDNAAYLNWIRIHNPDRSGQGFQIGIVLEKIPTPLYYATLFGLEEVVRLLVDKGANVNAQGGYFGNPLYAASHEGHEAVVRLLLDKGADINAQGKLYSNALYAASNKGYEVVVRLLLDKGANVNAQGKVYGNALYAASNEGYEAVVRLLLDKGANVNAQGGLYGNALYAASSKGYEAVVRLLLDKGVNVNVQGGYFGSALYAALNEGHEAVVRLLLDKGANVKALDQIGRTPLLLAAENGNVAIVSLFMTERPGLLQNPKDSRLSLLHIVANELDAVVGTIRTKDKDKLNAKTLEYGYTPLHWAAARGHERVVELLLWKGVDADSKDWFNQSPLLLAAANGHKEVVRLLLAIDGVDPNSADNHPEHGQTPLAWAAKKGHTEVVSMLLAKDGIHMNCVDRRGRTPQVLAEEGRHDAVLRVLQSCS
jgi:ankyrin repeat protein